MRDIDGDMFRQDAVNTQTQSKGAHCTKCTAIHSENLYHTLLYSLNFDAALEIPLIHAGSPLCPVPMWYLWPDNAQSVLGGHGGPLERLSARQRHQHLDQYVANSRYRTPPMRDQHRNPDQPTRAMRGA